MRSAPGQLSFPFAQPEVVRGEFTANLVLHYAVRLPGGVWEGALGAWHKGMLVTVVRLSPLLSPSEHRQLEHWIEQHSQPGRGAVQLLPPRQVFRVDCTGLRIAPRRAARLALEDPRCTTWCRDFRPESAARLTDLWHWLHTPPP